jgi:hypothetical protein
MWNRYKATRFYRWCAVAWFRVQMIGIE